MNLPPEDNLRKEDKSSAPKVSFIRRFHCTLATTLLSCFVVSEIVTSKLQPLKKYLETSSKTKEQTEVNKRRDLKK